MSGISGRALVVLSALTVLAATAVGCAAPGADGAASSPQPPVSAPSGAPLAVPTDPRFGPGDQQNWLTGEDVPTAPVLAVKIDNTSQARPVEGIQAADVVYVEEVEGGMTRLVAVLSTELPPRVGPIRSARTSDIQILGSYGSPALAYSGGNAGVVAQLEASPLSLVGFDQSRTGYVRDPGRRAPYNVMADPAALLDRASGASSAQDVGFRFGEAGRSDGPASFAEYAWSSARLRVDWSAADERWLLTMDGRPMAAAEGGQLGADTVVFQAVPVVPSPFVDVNGSPSPEVRPVGGGSVTVLRDGRVLRGSWERAAVTDPTTFLDGEGEELMFAPGQTWVVYVAEGQSPTVG